MSISTPSILLCEENDGQWTTTLHYGNGMREQLPSINSAEDLIAAAEIDYRDYRREIQRLRTEHPLFEDSLDISVLDFEDLVAQAVRLPSMLQKTDPVSFFVLSHLSDFSFLQKDDGSASFLLYPGKGLLRLLEAPLRTQICLRNIMEVAFDGMERTTQQERFEKLNQVYPEISKMCDPATIPVRSNQKRIFTIDTIFNLRLMELALYFQQDDQRIARCEYCWGYFIPKTRKETHYCDRTTDGYLCKNRGARFKRNRDAEQDPALLVCKKLRDRMYARLLRYQDAALDERVRLTHMDFEQYDAWSENARLARMEYLDGTLSAEDFLRKIDTTGELQSYEVDRAKLVGADTVWQRLVAGDLAFDPKTHYASEFMQLDMGTKYPKWETVSAEDLQRRDQVGHQSLQDEFGKNKKADG